ncbi:MAG: hypothetical protein WBW56_21535 [Syntrophobacteraceae bacterium]
MSREKTNFLNHGWTQMDTDSEQQKITPLGSIATRGIVKKQLLEPRMDMDSEQ